MSRSFLSFGAVAEFANNGIKSVSPIGEISNKSKTYSKDQGIFAFNDKPSSTVLHNFLSLEDDNEIVMPADIANKQLEVSNWLVDQAKKGNITGSRAAVLALLKAQFTNGIEILDIGEMVTNNQYWLPSFITGNHLVGTDKQAFYLWFADEYFKREYPRVVFAVVHPVAIEDMDSLMHMNFQEMDVRLAKETPDVISKRMHDVTDNAEWPVTDGETISFELMDLVNVGQSSTGWWRYMWWGNGIDSEDQLLEQIREEILKDTIHTLEDWEEKIPDLFNPIEFYVIPTYNRYGLQNKTNASRNLSPIVDNETRMELVDKYLTPHMTLDHVIKSTQFVPVLYKSYGCAFVSKLNARPGTTKIYDLFKDYSLISSDDSDFDLMNKSTQELIRNLEDLLSAAEVMTDISLPKPGITRVTRFGKMYAARRVGKMKLLVLTRWQMVEDGVEGL